MARTASIILTKEDKKAKIADLNDNIKAAKSEIKGIAVAVKENDAALKAEVKEHASVAKALEKEATKLAKELALLEAQKSALVNDTSVAPSLPVNCEVKPKRTRRTKAEMEAFRASQAAA